jgi:L-ascorbate metabolism protein UlaG (beta-lactamase superfamily)
MVTAPAEETPPRVSPTSSVPSERSDASLTFVGTATTILRLGRFTVLTDPNFLRRGQRAYLGKGLWSRRLTEPAMTVDELPPLSAVVLSHLHGDHFDRVARAGLDRTPPIITTVPAADRLQRYGFSTQGLENWQQHTLVDGPEELSIESLPAVHAHGLMGRLLPPVMGSLLEHRIKGTVVRRVLLSGDTLTGPHLDTIHQHHPDIDIAVVHLGGTRVLWHTVTMDAAQGLDYLRRIRPKRAVPVHYDDYGVMRSPLSEFLEAVSAADLSGVVRPVRRGDHISL